MKTILLLITALLFTTHASVAQWTRITAIPPQDMRAIVLFGDTILALSDTNLLYKSVDGGSSWDSVIVSNNSVLMISLKIIDSIIYIGTTNHGIFYSADDGLTWTNTGNGLFAVADIIKYGNDIYAATEGNGVYIFNQTGNNWIPFNDSLPTYSLNVFNMVSTPNSFLIGAGANGTFYRYNFIDHDWNEEYYDGMLHPGLKIDKLISNSDTIFAVDGNRIIRSEDDGVSWVNDKSGTHDGTYRVIFTGVDKQYTMTNIFSGGTWVQERSRNSAAGSTWATNQDFVPNGLSYDILEFQNKLFLGRNDGLYVKNLASGIDNFSPEENHLEIYPNPSGSSAIKISCIDQVKYFTITNSLGQISISENAGEKEFTINPDLAKGVYFITLHLESDQEIVKRIIIE